MKQRRANQYSVGLILLAFGVAAALYGQLPDPVPIHWDASGAANGYLPKPWGAFAAPLSMLACFALLRALPRISPRGFRLDRFEGVYHTIQVTLLAFLLVGTTLALLAGGSEPVSMERAAQAGAGLLFVVLGNLMGKITRNFFVGIKTPWTLASDEVWLRTHRFGGRTFVLAGVGLLLAALLGGVPGALLVATAVAGVPPVIYSYLAYRQLEGFRNGSAGGAQG